jgi:hypothetical protein
LFDDYDGWTSNELEDKEVDVSLARPLMSTGTMFEEKDEDKFV